LSGFEQLDPEYKEEGQKKKQKKKQGFTADFLFIFSLAF